MKSGISDAAYFYKHNFELLTGFCTNYVGDTPHAGNESYFKLFETTGKPFKYERKV